MTTTRAPSDDTWRGAVDARLRSLGYDPSGLIEVLHTLQESSGCLDTEGLAYVAAALRIPLSKVYGVATFYSLFRLQPAGAHSCVVCTGTACHITGAPALLDGIASGLEVRPGGTTADGRVSLDTTRCIGTCSLAPLVVLDGDVLGRISPADAVATLEKL